MYAFLLGQKGLFGSNETAQKGILRESESVGHASGSGQKELCPLHNDAQLPKVFDPEPAHPPRAENAFSGDGPHAGDAQKGFVIGSIDLHRIEFRMSQSPAAFWVHAGIKIPVLFIQEFLSPEVVEPQEPIGLIEPVFPEEGWFCVLRG